MLICSSEYLNYKQNHYTLQQKITSSSKYKTQLQNYIYSDEWPLHQINAKRKQHRL